MNAVKNFIGVDVSKKTIDVAVIVNADKEHVFHQLFSKDPFGFKKLFKWLDSLNVSLDESTVFCMEHTGLYNRNLLSTLCKSKVIVWVEMAHHIQRSLGLQRGKSDKIDSRRIAVFAYKNREDIKHWQPVDASIERLKALLGQRERLLQAKVKLSVQVKELAEEGMKEEAKLLESLQREAVKGIVKSIEKVEAAIRAIIRSDEELMKKVKQITSVTGVGEVIAWNFIVFTNGFKRLGTGKQLACYCGVVPFRHQSGSSIKGRSRVSHMANKKLKTLLHMGAMAAITYDPEIKAFYRRKVVEGKNKMSILIPVRNKLILRIAAVVREDKHYVKMKTAA